MLGLSHVVALVGRDNHVGTFNDTLEGLVHGLSVGLEFKNTTINLVDEKNWLDLLGEGLAEHSFGLDADTFNVVDDDESAISNSQSSCDFLGEINMAWGVNQVDEVGDNSLLVDDIRFVVKGHTG